ncbi:MAG TPA: helix-turn-helix domain-containing protein [Chloroflexota bacterium]|nr:helix-turn-helix domain-containing protein [Chloroflexota bacterium]
MAVSDLYGACDRCADVPAVLIDAWRTAIREAGIRSALHGGPRSFLPPTGLTPSERRLLTALRLAAPTPVTQRGLLEAIDGGRSGENSIRSHVQRLRRKVEPLGYEIRNVRGRGYCLAGWPQTP